jgi:hypothetical protein
MLSRMSSPRHTVFFRELLADEKGREDHHRVWRYTGPVGLHEGGTYIVGAGRFTRIDPSAL